MSGISSFDRPINSTHDTRFGSDTLAETFQDLGMEYLAVCPGTSLRGFHDSVVNHLGNLKPQLVTALHEESAVSIAHGYAKVTGKAMGVMTHANVGLLHASMSVFNAWCDRVPMIVIGGVGPVDSTKRRPWIDWIHSSQDLGAIVRNFTKWDDQPGSIKAGVESIRRAWSISHTLPQGPTFLNFDAGQQEDADASVHRAPTILNDALPSTGVPLPATIGAIAEAAAAAAYPLLLVGRVELDDETWAARVSLAERFGMRVIGDIKARAGFPTDHPLYGPGGGLFLSETSLAEFDRSDFVLSLDWIDLGVLTNRPATHPRRVVHASTDHVSHRGWNADYQILPTVEWHLHCTPAAVVTALLEVPLARPPASTVQPTVRKAPAAEPSDSPITMPFLGATLKDLLHDGKHSLVRVPLRWHYDWIEAHTPLDFLGFDGGFGLGSGPGMLVGAALALAGTDRLAVAVLGDGDMMMGGTAFWTAAHYRLPMLAIIANNASFYTDELHQERMANDRGRPAANKWIGQAIADPLPDLAMFAKSLGIEGIGTVSARADLRAALAEGLRLARSGKAVLVDVRVHGS